MFVVGGSAGVDIAKRVVDIFDEASLVSLKRKRFPDKEFYVRILDDLKGKDVVVIQTSYPDENLVELLITMDAVVEAGAKSLTVVLPYFSYSRQDKKFKEGEPVSARAVAKMVSVYADNVISIDPHKDYILDFFDAKTKCCSAVGVLADHLKSLDVDFVLAPDKGALERAKSAAGIIGCDFDYMQKTRIDGNTVEIKPKQLEAKGKTVAIIDDIISTGGTMAKSIAELKRQGAKKVIVSCTHGLFIGQALEKLKSAGCDEIIATDTILSNYSKVSCAPCIVDALKDLL